MSKGSELQILAITFYALAIFEVSARDGVCCDGAIIKATG